MSKIEKNEAGLYAVEVDGKMYEFEKFGAEQSLETLLDIGQIVGKPLGAAIAGLSGQDGDVKQRLMDRELDLKVIELVMEAITGRLDKKTIMPMIKRMTSEKVLCEGKKINFNIHYQDDLMHMFNVLKAALEVQYGNFFVALAGVLGLKVKPKVTNQVPRT